MPKVKVIHIKNPEVNASICSVSVSNADANFKSMIRRVDCIECLHVMLVQSADDLDRIKGRMSQLKK